MRQHDAASRRLLDYLGSGSKNRPEYCVDAQGIVPGRGSRGGPLQRAAALYAFGEIAPTFGALVGKGGRWGCQRLAVRTSFQSRAGGRRRWIVGCLG